MRQVLDDYGLYFAWLVAIAATAGSLYYSEVRQFVPCSLCWYQRIFMYPLVVLLGIASLRQDRQITPYALSLAVIGGGIAIYHIMLQNIPGFGGIPMCNVGVPCNAKYVNWFGFISIPVMALTAFTMISLLLIPGLKRRS